jgi:hypothetical protein
MKTPIGQKNRLRSGQPAKEKADFHGPPSVLRTGRFPYLIAGLLLLAATGLRLIGAGNDLWLDEAWSVFITTQLHSPVDVFTLHHEINHHLNTLWLYLLGPGAPAAIYHAFPLVCGVLSVVVAALIGWRRGREGAWIAMIMVGFSYELVAYSAEARGYSSLVLFSLLSYYLLEAYLRRPRGMLAGPYALCAVLGLLSHPIFAAFLGAATLWSLYSLARKGRDVGKALVDTLACQGLPLVVLAVLYVIDYQHTVAGGGTSNDSLVSAVWTGLAWSLGSPQNTGVQLAIGGVAMLGIGFGLRNLVREGMDKWVFFSTVTLLFPVLLVLVRNSDLVYTRHFMVGATFLLILWSDGLAGLWKRGRLFRIACLGLLATYVGFNGWHIADWAANGRGQPREILRYIAAHAAEPSETIGSDSDFRVGLVVDYYRLGLPEAKGLRYLARNNRPPNGSDWVITHAESWMPSAAPPSEWRDVRGNRYRWVRTFRTAPLSGLHLFLYRNSSFHPSISAEKTEGT